MKEGLLELNYIPNVLRSSDVEKVPPDAELTKKVLDLMTPPEILTRGEFEYPEVIIPGKYPDFNSLLKARDRIRRLELLPVKTEAEYARYHKQPKEQLIGQVLDYLGDSNLALAYNIYPYWLPGDLEQSMVWVKDPSTSENEIAEFIARCTRLYKTLPEELILFERPLKISTKIVRGTFPDLRHIHYWRKITATYC